MKKKILAIVVTLLAVTMMLTPLAVQAIPGAEKKNDDKFVPFRLTKSMGLPVGIPVEIFRPEPPKETKFMRVIMHESLVAAEILIGTQSYSFGAADFTYDSTLTLDFHLNSDPMFCTFTVDYSLEFTETSGIDGTLEFRSVGKYWPYGKSGAGPAESWCTTNGFGTDGLDGVKVMDTGWHEPTGEIVHEGTITGWPGLP